MKGVRLDKLKRPGGVFSFEFRPLGEDTCGVWLFAPVGSSWTAPHDQGTLPFDVMTLITPGRCFVTWWVDDANDPRIEIDICLPPEKKGQAWAYVDLELDVFRHEPDAVEVKDREEFDVACGSGWITARDAEIAKTTMTEMRTALERRVEPWGDDGWRRLAHASRQLSD
jgi:hypothetical protein